MPQLRVLGISEDGRHLLCRNAERDDQTSFTVPIDERLRAAIRGDVSRFGQLEIEMEPQLRPREIQRRVRAGASVDQVAAAAACSIERVERYAYPVLMERSAMSEQAQAVHPLQSAALGTVGAAQADKSLVEIVTATLTERLQQRDMAWDAFRDERGWTVRLSWRAGRSENSAEWAFDPRPGGGTVTARNDAAADLVEPGVMPLRTVEATGSGADDRASRNPGATGDPGRRPRHGGPPSMTADEHLVADTVTDRRAAVEGLHPQEATRTGTDDGASQARSPGEGRSPGEAGASGVGSESAPAPGTGSGSASASGSAARSGRLGQKPPMPSWEDVLLGTRAAGR
jgi:hypothetical protein